MFEAFTDRARKVMAVAYQEAQRVNHEYFGSVHILLGLVSEGLGVSAHALTRRGATLHKVRREVKRLVGDGPFMVAMGKLVQTPSAKLVIGYAIEEAWKRKHDAISPEHLLLGLLREPEDVPAKVLVNLGLNLERVRAEVVAALGAVGGATESVRGKDEELSPPPPGASRQGTPGRRFQARRSAKAARREADAARSPTVRGEYCLVVLLPADTGAARRVLAELGVSPAEVEARLQAPPGPAVTGVEGRDAGYRDYDWPTHADGGARSGGSQSPNRPPWRSCC